MTGQTHEEATSRRSSRGCGLIGCLVIIVVLVALGFGGAAISGALDQFADRFRPPHEVVRGYLSAYQDDDIPRAPLPVRGAP